MRLAALSNAHLPLAAAVTKAVSCRSYSPLVNKFVKTSAVQTEKIERKT
jgi:hypothetical protein